jgi:hypothetical protein
VPRFERPDLDPERLRKLAQSVVEEQPGDDAGDAAVAGRTTIPGFPAPSPNAPVPIPVGPEEGELESFEAFENDPTPLPHPDPGGEFADEGSNPEAFASEPTPLPHPDPDGGFADETSQPGGVVSSHGAEVASASGFVDSAAKLPAKEPAREIVTIHPQPEEDESREAAADDADADASDAALVSAGVAARGGAEESEVEPAPEPEEAIAASALVEEEEIEEESYAEIGEQDVIAVAPVVEDEGGEIELLETEEEWEPERRFRGVVFIGAGVIVVAAVAVFLLSRGGDKRRAESGADARPRVAMHGTADAAPSVAAHDAGAPADALIIVIEAPADAAAPVVRRPPVDAAAPVVRRPPVDAAPVVVRRPPVDAATPVVRRPPVDAAPVVVRTRPDASPAIVEPHVGKRFKDYMKEAKRAQRQRRYDEALALVELALADRQKASGYQLKADILMAQGKPRDALGAIDEAVRLSNRAHKAWLTKGMLHYELKEYPEAREALEKYLELKPNARNADTIKILLEDLWGSLAGCHFGAGRPVSGLRETDAGARPGKLV